VPMDDLRSYQHAMTDFMGWMQKNMAHRVRKVGRSERLLKVGYLLRLAAKMKLRATVEWINRVLDQTDEKIVVMAVHQKAIRVLEKRIRAKSVIIDGSVTGRARFAAVDQFQMDPKTRVCIGNIRAAGTGITLTAARILAF